MVTIRGARHFLNYLIDNTRLGTKNNAKLKNKYAISAPVFAMYHSDSDKYEFDHASIDSNAFPTFI